eukprot:NODE_385_length_8329_cov_0.434386.p4 type:complete len:173 gc:universal NODE_385_length_8329_cov_0.434386:6461-6979(+)
MMKLLAWLCLTGKCDTIDMRFMIKGHTKFSPDAGFGHIKKKYALQDVFTVDQVKTLIESSATSNDCKVFPSRRFKEYRSKLNVFFDDIPGIRGYQSFQFKKDLPGKVMLKKLVSDTVVITIDLNKHNVEPDSDFYQFKPSVCDVPELTVRKKTDLNKSKRYIPREFHSEYPE